jgi:hypothetical protein
MYYPMTGEGIAASLADFPSPSPPASDIEMAETQQEPHQPIENILNVDKIDDDL